jgi:lysophospholipase L1-like esterase
VRDRERHRRRVLVGVLAGLVLLIGGPALVRFAGVGSAAARTHRHDPTAAVTLSPARPGSHWVASWGTAPQPATDDPGAERGFDDQTIRQIVLTSAGGARIRVRLSNVYGSRPLEIGRAGVAIAGAGAALRAGTSHALTFGGRSSVLIPAGAEVLSDPAALAVAPGTQLAVSIFLRAATGPATQHAQARQITYVSAGDRALAAGAAAFNDETTSWYFLDGLDVLAGPRVRGAVVALGDSITDGVGTAVDADARWTDDLARHLAARPGDTLSVVDAGIGGNRVLNNSLCCGISAVARFEHDVVDTPGVRAVILLEGINDIGSGEKHGRLSAPHTDVSALQIVDGYERIIALAHAARLKIFGATLTPFAGARYWTPAGEAKREAVNRWIRTSHAFDGVIDFARVLAAPGHPLHLNPAYDSGDHLHPDAAGYRAMAKVVNLKTLLSAA